MVKEIWMPILGYEGYEVSNQGRVRSLNYRNTGKEKILRTENNHGYIRVGLCKDGKQKRYRVHRLVWEAFNGPIPDGYVINHVNEKKDDNHLENLNLMTQKENVNWGTGIRRCAKSKNKMVEQYTLDGVHIMTWFSLKGAVEGLKQLGVLKQSISACCLGKLKSHKGYIWKYKEENSLQDA